jgi:protein TonB
MRKIFYTAGVLILCSVSYAQQSDPTDSTGKYDLIYGTMPEDSVKYVFKKIDQLPQFPKGNEGMLSYLSGNIHYPSKARKKNIQGKVIITFVVDKEGSIVDPRVIRSVDRGIDEEAMRVVKGMPKWKPGLLNGRPVKVLYHLPVSFKLEE